MNKLLLLSFALFSAAFAGAQELPAAMLQKTIDKIHTLKSLQYNYYGIQKNPFSTGDTSYTTMKSILVFDGKGQLINTRDETAFDKSRTVTIFRNDTLFQIDLRDSSYSIEPKHGQNDISMGFMSAIQSIKYSLDKHRSKIFIEKDTVVNGVKCRNFFVKIYDSVENGQHNFTYDYIAVDKTTRLPVFFMEKGEGIAERDGKVVGRLIFYNEDYFSDFKIDKIVNPSLFTFNLDGFSLPNKQMLVKGNDAPNLQLNDLNNKAVMPGSLKNKLVLIEFGATDCSANPLANPMMNRLNKKYKSTDLSIVSVYSGEPAEKVKKYVESNQLEFQVFTGSRKQSKAFKIIGTPNFYLVDKNGKIVGAYDGYYDDLEKDLTKNIDKELQKKTAMGL